MTKTACEKKSGQLNVGTYLLDRLASLGVKHIFGIPGDYILRFNKMVEEHSIAFINATRENTAGYMADSYARVRGLGVACITYGVGINIVNAMAQAFVESSPLVVISGSPAQAEYDRSLCLHHMINSCVRGGRDMTQMELFAHLTVDRALLSTATEAPKQIDRVLTSCLTHKKPVYLELPRDIVNFEVQGEEPFSRPLSHEKKSSHDPKALSEFFDEMVHLLQKSKRPLLWVGHEVERFGLSEQLLSFAERYHIPIAATLLGKGVIDEKHPLFIGVYQGKMSLPAVAEYVESCDIALIVGVLLSDLHTGFFSAPMNFAHQLQINSSFISVDHHHYQDIAFCEVIEKMAQLKANLRFRHDYPSAIDRENQPPFCPAATENKICIDRFFKALQSFINRDTLLIADIGDSLFGCSDLIVGQKGFMACAYYGSLGFAIPAAIAAQLAMPHRRIVAVVGDGASQISLTELSTAIRYGLAPVIILLNNHGYGTERPLIEGKFNDIVNWNYSKLPELLGGGRGVLVRDEQTLERELKSAFERRDCFTLLEVEVDKEDFSAAMRRFSSYAAKLARGKDEGEKHSEGALSAP